MKVEQHDQIQTEIIMSDLESYKQLFFREASEEEVEDEAESKEIL